jgi:hypothetical protein
MLWCQELDKRQCEWRLLTNLPQLIWAVALAAWLPNPNWRGPSMSAEQRKSVT